MRSALSNQFGISVADFIETDMVRVQAFVEALEANEVPLPPSGAEVEVWFGEVRENLDTIGEPLTIVTLAICATIAFCPWRDPHFLSTSLRSLSTRVKETREAANGFWA
jgi:hypothetical protein